MNQAADIRNRLRRVARERKIDMQLLLTTYGIQRMLHRLGQTSHARRYVLKGAQLLQALASEHAFRATRDVDLAARSDPSTDALRQVMLDLANLDEDDGLEFDVDSFVVEEIRDRTEYGGLRGRMQVYLDGARIPLRLDVGFGDALVPDPVPIRMRTLTGISHPPGSGRSRSEKRCLCRGGSCRTRTYNPLIKSQLLCQLS